MKKGPILLLLIGLITHTVLGQIVCGYEQTDALESKTTRYIENGGVFTHKFLPSQILFVSLHS